MTRVGVGFCKLQVEGIISEKTLKWKHAWGWRNNKEGSVTGVEREGGMWRETEIERGERKGDRQTRRTRKRTMSTVSRVFQNKSQIPT